MAKIDTLFTAAHDGRLFHKAVMKRLSRLPGRTLSDVCIEAKIEFSTAWRWQEGSSPSVKTVRAVERAFNKFERAHIVSSSSGIKPSARL